MCYYFKIIINKSNYAVFMRSIFNPSDSRRVEGWNQDSKEMWILVETLVWEKKKTTNTKRDGTGLQRKSEPSLLEEPALHPDCLALGLNKSGQGLQDKLQTYYLYCDSTKQGCTILVKLRWDNSMTSNICNGDITNVNIAIYCVVLTIVSHVPHLLYAFQNNSPIVKATIDK